ncbi:hypothetical protein [Dictyobacter aurantiacus]|nr:hypothetical protein [Dictyobacter aurantiacus]
MGDYLEENRRVYAYYPSTIWVGVLEAGIAGIVSAKKIIWVNGVEFDR